MQSNAESRIFNLTFRYSKLSRRTRTGVGYRDVVRAARGSRSTETLPFTIVEYNGGRFMNQGTIIFDLLTWLEDHLTNPLSLDNVALKAGYSKWHLQRMFKEVTGQVLGSYIRARRLSKAAVSLRLTNRPIMEIALEYHFDSQQTFTRAFKKQFGQSPGRYRRSSDWTASGLCPPIHPGDLTLAESIFMTFPETVLIGQTQNYTCEPTTLPTIKMK